MKYHVRKTCFSLSFILVLFLNACGRPTQENLENSELSDYYKLTGSIVTEISTNQILSDGTHSVKTISLNSLVITDSFHQNQNLMMQLGETALSEEKDYREGIIPFNESPGAVDLGMNNVPVLDQGAYGTCVTFSTTALLDALLEKGDVISQQCTLALNKELGSNYWDGAQNALQILRPLRKYGIIEQNKCVSSYPTESQKITTDDYRKSINEAINVATVTGNFIEPINLNIVRSALKNKHRIVLGFGMKKNYSNISVAGFDMKIKNKSTMGGLWACQQPSSSLNYCGIPNSGHAVVVIGYDDNQQLLKIRNSWSESIGDDGDYYMSYKFFELMSFNGTEMY